MVKLTASQKADVIKQYKSWNKQWAINTVNNIKKAANTVTNKVSNNNIGWWSTTTKRNNTTFVDPSVLHDQYMGKSNEEIASKWWGPNATVNSTGWHKVLQALAKNNKVYWTGWYQQYNHSTGLHEKPNTGLNKANSKAWNIADPASQYSEASYKNYTNAFNRFKEQWMDDTNARNEAAKLLENENLIKNKTEEEKAAEQAKAYDDSWLNNVLNWVADYWEWLEEAETPEENKVSDEEFDELLGNYLQDNYWISADDLWDLVSSNTKSNVIKETVPEEEYTGLDMNTYYNWHIADQTPYEGWQSTDIQKEWLTFSEKYEEPVTNALQDLGLLTPNEQASETMPNTEEEVTQPETYNSAEDIVNEFNEVAWWALNWETATPEDVTRVYSDYKKKLEKFVNDNKLSKEEYDNFLNQMRSNEWVQEFLRNKYNK